MAYYFDVLPLHPPPEYLESLTSYLMRLAELNGISSIDGISALCFSHQDRRITREIADFPPVEFGELTKVGAWSEEILRQTTFFHLAAKFGRSTLPQPVSRFLSGCVGQYLRYCPVCFAEQQVRYYLLPWRFLIALGQCPMCGRNLKLCVAASETTETQLEVATRVHNDIIFLLIPQSWETDGVSVIKRVGRRLSYIRQTQRLTAVELASRIGVTLTVVEGIERGDVQGRGATLQSYFKYARYLRLNLQEVFSSAIDVPDHNPTILLPLCPACQQNDHITRYGHNRNGSQRYRCQRCYSSFTA